MQSFGTSPMNKIMRKLLLVLVFMPALAFAGIVKLDLPKNQNVSLIVIAIDKGTNLKSPTAEADYIAKAAESCSNVSTTRLHNPSSAAIVATVRDAFRQNQSVRIFYSGFGAEADGRFFLTGFNADGKPELLGVDQLSPSLMISSEQEKAGSVRRGLIRIPIEPGPSLLVIADASWGQANRIASYASNRTGFNWWFSSPNIGLLTIGSQGVLSGDGQPINDANTPVNCKSNCQVQLVNRIDDKPSVGRFTQVISGTFSQSASLPIPTTANSVYAYLSANGTGSEASAMIMGDPKVLNEDVLPCNRSRN